MGSSSNERRKQKWETKKRRKLNAEQIKHTNVSYTALLQSVKSGSPEVVQNHVKQLLRQLQPQLHKEGVVHDSSCVSRCLQACLKHSTQQQKVRILEHIMGDFTSLSLFKYGHKLALKMLMYADKDVTTQLTKLLHARTDICFSKFGSRVFEYAYQHARNAQEQRQLLYSVLLTPTIRLKLPVSSFPPVMPFPELWASLDESTRRLLIDSLKDVIQKCVDKELLDKLYIHTTLKWLSSMVKEDSEMVEVLSRVFEGALLLTTSKDGVESFVRLLGYATSKQRRQFVKLLKNDRVMQFCKSDISHVVVMRLLATVDDTKMLSETIVKEMGRNLSQLCFDKYGHKIIMQILCPAARRYFTEHERVLVSLPSPTSLKSPEIRRSELMAALDKPLTTVIENGDGSSSQTQIRKKPKTDTKSLNENQDVIALNNEETWETNKFAKHVLREYVKWKNGTDES